MEISDDTRPVFDGWEPAEVIALFGVVIAPAAAIGGAFFQHRLQQAQQQRIDAERVKEEWAAILAPVMALLIDANPERLGINANPETSPQAVTELFDRWAEIRVPLFHRMILETDEETRGCARELEIAIYNSLIMTSNLIRSLLLSRSERQMFEQANEDYKKAKDRAAELSLRVRDDVE